MDLYERSEKTKCNNKDKEEPLLSDIYMRNILQSQQAPYSHDVDLAFSN